MVLGNLGVRSRVDQVRCRVSQVWCRVGQVCGLGQLGCEEDLRFLPTPGCRVSQV